MLRLMNLVIYVVILFVGVCPKKLPSFIEVCHRSDPKLSECVVHNAMDIIAPKLKQGIPELGIPSFDPLLIPEVTLTGGQDIKATFSDIQMYNATNFIIEDVKYAWDNLTFAFTVILPKIVILSNYHLKGKILFLDLEGRGNATGEYLNIRAVIRGHATTYDKKGRTFFKLQRDNIDLEIGSAHLEFDRLFGDNKELNERTNAIINENIQVIIKELKPVIVEIIAAFAYGIVDRIYEKYGADDLFLDP